MLRLALKTRKLLLDGRRCFSSVEKQPLERYKGKTETDSIPKRDAILHRLKSGKVREAHDLAAYLLPLISPCYLQYLI